MATSSYWGGKDSIENMVDISPLDKEFYDKDNERIILKFPPEELWVTLEEARKVRSMLDRAIEQVELFTPKA